MSVRAFIVCLGMSTVEKKKKKQDKDRTNVYGYFLEVEPTQIGRLTDQTRPFFGSLTNISLACLIGLWAKQSVWAICILPQE